MVTVTDLKTFITMAHNKTLSQIETLTLSGLSLDEKFSADCSGLPDIPLNLKFDLDLFKPPVLTFEALMAVNNINDLSPAPNTHFNFSRFCGALLKCSNLKQFTFNNNATLFQNPDATMLFFRVLNKLAMIEECNLSQNALGSSFILIDLSECFLNWTKKSITLKKLNLANNRLVILEEGPFSVYPFFPSLRILLDSRRMHIELADNNLSATTVAAFNTPLRPESKSDDNRPNIKEVVQKIEDLANLDIFSDSEETTAKSSQNAIIQQANASAFSKEEVEKIAQTFRDCWPENLPNLDPLDAYVQRLKLKTEPYLLACKQAFQHKYPTLWPQENQTQPTVQHANAQTTTPANDAATPLLPVLPMRLSTTAPVGGATVQSSNSNEPPVVIHQVANGDANENAAVRSLTQGR